MCEFINNRTAPLQEGDFGRMVDVPPRGEGDGETERGKRQLPGPGAANAVALRQASATEREIMKER
jgi:hypothetical protein